MFMCKLARKGRPRNDLYCVGWNVQPHSLAHSWQSIRTSRESSCTTPWHVIHILQLFTADTQQIEATLKWSICIKRLYIAAAATVARTTKDGGRLTISSRILLQKTTNNKTIELYHYDAQVYGCIPSKLEPDSFLLSPRYPMAWWCNGNEWD